MPGVRQCWALICRDAMFPILRLAMRTPIVAGDWPTVPMEYWPSIMILKISWAILTRSGCFFPFADGTCPWPS